MKDRDFTCDAEVWELVKAFAACTLPLAEFSHAAHLAVALAILDRCSVAEGTEHMRIGLRRFLAAHGQNTGYHETLTVFWMRVLAHFSATRYAGRPLWERVNALTEWQGRVHPVATHYSREVVSAAEARGRWIAPDLEPLPF